MKSRNELHLEICKELNEIYNKKNNDYGHSFGKTRKKNKNAIVVRLADKFHRLENLLNGHKAEVKEESILDTLMDMANYCIMELIEYKIDEMEAKQEKEETQFKPDSEKIKKDEKVNAKSQDKISKEEFELTRDFVNIFRCFADKDTKKQIDDALAELQNMIEIDE